MSTVSTVNLAVDEEGIDLWVDYGGYATLTPEEAVQLSRALVKAAAEALGVGN